MIKKIEKIKSVYTAWKPSDVAFVKSLEWSINNLVIIFYCQLRSSVNGWPDTSKEFFEIKVNFINVSNLKLDFSGAGLHQTSGFDILDVSNNGLEEINFQIEDYENDSINFSCEEIEIIEVSNPEKIVIAQNATKGGGSWAKTSGILRDALKGKGTYGLGSGTAQEAMQAGKAWVGEGFEMSSNGRFMISKDGLRQFQPANFKPKLGIEQANFYWKNLGQKKWQSNGHLDIIKP